MAQVQTVVGGTDLTPAGATQFFALAVGDSANDTTEAEREITYQTAGTLSDFFVRVTVNATSAASTVRTRINGGNGNLSVSIAGAATGIFEDTVNTDSVSVGDEVNTQSVAGAGGSITFSLIGALFDSDVNTVTRLAAPGNGFASGTDSISFTMLMGTGVTASSEEDNRLKVRTAGTLRDYFLFVATNGRTSTTTLGSRISGSNGNLSVSVGAAATGVFEDNASSDIIAVGDYAGYRILTGSGVGTLATRVQSVEFETTDNGSVMGQGRMNATVNVGDSFFFVLSGVDPGTTTESERELLARFDLDVSDLWVRITTNTLTTAATTITFRISGVDSTVGVSIAAGATGEFEDTDSDAVLATDLINYDVTVDVGGTGNITLMNRSIRLAAPAAAPAPAGDPLFGAGVAMGPQVVAVPIQVSGY